MEADSVVLACAFFFIALGVALFAGFWIDLYLGVRRRNDVSDHDYSLEKAKRALQQMNRN
jgi:hypothetical protein